MKAVGLYQSLPVESPDCLVDMEIPGPVPNEREVLISVRAAAVNPVDTKRRRNARPAGAETTPLILGYDAVGEVVALGAKVTSLGVGDRVWYASNVFAQGCNAEYQVVDERLIGHAPKSLEPTEATSLPLTGITALSAFRYRMYRFEEQRKPRRLLIIGAAGGVGSVAIQLARALTDVEVVATASRPESNAWCTELGAHQVIEHDALLADDSELSLGMFEFILNCASTSAYWPAMCRLIAPEGSICSVVESHEPVSIGDLMPKSATFAWEMMSTRPRYATDTMIQQQQILTTLASLVDEG